MMRVETRDLGLAAYMKMNGSELVDFFKPNRVFIFESDRDETAWRIEYLGSACHKHDRELMDLRRLFN